MGSEIAVHETEAMSSVERHCDVEDELVCDRPEARKQIFDGHYVAHRGCDPTGVTLNASAHYRDDPGQHPGE
jgi:hypothetical protein